MDKFDSVLSPYFSPDKPGATIIVTKNGKTLFRTAYGMADVEQKISLEPNMTMWLGSITKQFTAVAIMILAEEGKLAVSDHINKYLPKYPTYGKTITIENLLTHTSGIKNYTEIPTFEKIVKNDVSAQQIVDYFQNEPLKFDPGTKSSYSNSGYILLGLIIETVSGESYQNYIAEHIFKPLGMVNTAYEGYERESTRKAVGYSGTKKADRMSMTWPYAAGGIVSNVDDLAVWDAAISTGKLLKPASWQQIFTPFKLPRPWNMPFAYGWLVAQFKKHPTLEHGGMIPGFSTHAMRLPDDKIYVAVLMNDDGGKPSLFNALASLFWGKTARSITEKAAAIAIGEK